MSPIIFRTDIYYQIHVQIVMQNIFRLISSYNLLCWVIRWCKNVDQREKIWNTLYIDSKCEKKNIPCKILAQTVNPLWTKFFFSSFFGT